MVVVVDNYQARKRKRTSNHINMVEYFQEKDGYC